MLRNMTIGQYYDVDSPVHRLDPRTKMTALLVYMVLLFTAESVGQYVLLALATVVFVCLSKVPAEFVIRGLKPVALLVVITAVLNLLMTRSGDVLVEYGIFKITTGGVRLSLSMAARVMMLVTGSSVLTLTTAPTVLTGGLEKMMAPLSKLKFPSHEIAMMMSIALRFIPTLCEEADKIMKAQTARGVDFSEGGLIKRLKAMTPLLVPLFVSAFRRADDLAMAMETRCYHGGARTSYRELKFKKRDLAAGVLMAFLAAGSLLLRFGVGI